MTEIPIIQKHSCGTCTLCCKVMGVKEFNKDPLVWCEHCHIGKGCKIYETRPETCREFECLWLQTPDMPDEMRPDRSRVVLTANKDGDMVVAFPDPGYPDAAEKGLVGKMLRSFADKGIVGIVALGDNRKVLYRSSKVDAKVLEVLTKFKHDTGQ